MTFSALYLLSILALLTIRATSGPTSIFIDQVSAYDLLASCAENEVSLVVRDMSYSCGDGGKTTSYGCFCFSSSVKYSHMIDTRAAKACITDASQNKTAVQVFSSYCKLGDIASVSGSSATDAKTTASSSPTNSRSAAPSPTTVLVTHTPTGTTESYNTSHKVIPIAGVSVPVGVIAIGLLGFLLYRLRRHRNATRDPAELSGNDIVTEAPPMQEVYELKRECRVPPIEIGDGASRAESGAPVKDTYAHAPVHQLDGEERRENS